MGTRDSVANLFGLESDDALPPAVDTGAAADPAAGTDTGAADPAAAPSVDDAVAVAEVYEEPISETDGVDCGAIPEAPVVDPNAVATTSEDDADPLAACGDTPAAADPAPLDLDAPVAEPIPAVDGAGADGAPVATAESWFMSLESDLEDVSQDIADGETEAAAASTDAAAVVGDPEAAAAAAAADIDEVSEPSTDEGVDVALPTDADTAAAQESILPDGTEDGSVDTPVVDAGVSAADAVEEMPTNVDEVTDTIPAADGGDPVVVATAERWFVSLESDIEDMAVGGTDIDGEPTGQEPASPQPTETPAPTGTDPAADDPAAAASSTESVGDVFARLGVFAGSFNTNYDAATESFLML